jgi:hypothetical protein
MALLTGGCSVIRGKQRETPRPAKSLLLRSDISLEGALNAQQKYDINFTSADVTDCVAFASRKSASASAVSLVLPMPATIGKQHLLWTAAITPYGGPGEYDLTKIPGLAVEIRVGKAKTGDRFVVGSDSEATATVKKSGSGSFIFSKLHKATEVLSGTVHWTCSDKA